MFPIRNTIPRQRFPFMTWLIILSNIAVFISELYLSPRDLDTVLSYFGLVPRTIFHLNDSIWLGDPTGLWLPFLTSLFLHGGWFHLIANMWNLLLFGATLEDTLGRFHFVLFYLMSGVTAGIFQVLLNVSTSIPTIGASGAVAGVMGAFFLLFPFSRIVILIPIFIFPLLFEIPAIIYLFLWFITQVYSGALMLTMKSEGVAGIAFWAHIGGFISGIFFMGVFVRKQRHNA